MKIQLDGVTLNKTRHFLMPCLRKYGEQFEKYLLSIHKIAYGIGDFILDREYQQHLFILVDTSRKVYNFKKFMLYIKQHESYEDDYAYDNPLKGKLHMLVLKIPQECYIANRYFREGYYSLMYSEDEIKTLLTCSSHAINVCKKKHDYKVDFIARLNRVFNGVNISIDDIGNRELELPPYIDRHNEYFE